MHTGVGYVLYFVVFMTARELRNWQTLELGVMVVMGCKFHSLRGTYFRGCILLLLWSGCTDRVG